MSDQVQASDAVYYATILTIRSAEAPITRQAITSRVAGVLGRHYREAKPEVYAAVRELKASGKVDNHRGGTRGSLHGLYMADGSGQWSPPTSRIP